MITLYQFSSSPFTEKVSRILSFKGLDYQVEEINRLKAKNYREVSPFGKFPAIDISDEPVCDSTDIAHTLEDIYPAKKLIPADKLLKAQVHIIEDWADESLYFYEMTMRVSWLHNAKNTLAKIKNTLPPLPDWLLLKIIVKKASKIVAAQGLGRKCLPQIVNDVRRHLEAINSMLSDSQWLVGDNITLADIAVVAQLNCLLDAVEVQEMLDLFPAIVPWIARVDKVAPYKKLEDVRDHKQQMSPC